MNPSPEPRTFEVLHYLGSDDDRGGIVSHLRALAAEAPFECLLGVNEGCRQGREPPLPVREFQRLDGERIGLRTLWSGHAVARTIGPWLRSGPNRVFHGHSRAGLVVALWLARGGAPRTVVSVHCYGRQRWFYRMAARRLEGRLFWLSPQMKAHYGITHPGTWDRCIPSCIPSAVLTPASGPSRRRADGEVRLGGIGALVAWKGWELVPEAIARLPEDLRRRVTFEHIGAPTGSAASHAYASALRSRTRELGLEDRVRWRGEEPSSARLLGEIDCLVVASRAEPFTVAGLEALARGVPVLSTDRGGLRDFVAPGMGWFFRSGDADDLRDAIAGLVGGGRLAQVHIDPDSMRRFSAPVVAEQWAAVYSRLQAADPTTL